MKSAPVAPVLVSAGPAKISTLQILVGKTLLHLKPYDYHKRVNYYGPDLRKCLKKNLPGFSPPQSHTPKHCLILQG